MTHRERFVGILEGRRPDRVPAVCRLDPWYKAAVRHGTMPHELRGKSLEQVQLHLGLGVSARAATVFKTRFAPPVRFSRRREGPELIDEWHAPAGTLRRVWRFQGDEEACGLSPTIVEFPLKTMADYAVFEQVVSHQIFEADYDAYRAYDAGLGANGLPLVILHLTPAHDILLNWAGYEQGYIDLLSEREAVERAVATAEGAYEQRMWEVVARSPCRFVLHGAHFDSSMTPPGIFRRYFLPYAQRFNQRMHAAGKWTAFHADADLTLLLDLVGECGYDVADCLAVAPLVKCTLDQIRQAWGNRIVLWGGVPGTLLEASTPQAQFDQHVEMIRSMFSPADRFIAGISDQAMPPALFRRLRALAAAFSQIPLTGLHPQRSPSGRSVSPE